MNDSDKPKKIDVQISIEVTEDEKDKARKAEILKRQNRRDNFGCAAVIVAVLSAVVGISAYTKLCDSLSTPDVNTDGLTWVIAVCAVLFFLSVCIFVMMCTGDLMRDNRLWTSNPDDYV